MFGKQSKKGKSAQVDVPLPTQTGLSQEYPEGSFYGMDPQYGQGSNQFWTPDPVEAQNQAQFGYLPQSHINMQPLGFGDPMLQNSNWSPVSGQMSPSTGYPLQADPSWSNTGSTSVNSPKSPLSKNALDERLRDYHKQQGDSSHNRTLRQDIQHRSEQKKRNAVAEINEILHDNGIEKHGAANQLLAFIDLYRDLLRRYKALGRQGPA